MQSSGSGSRRPTRVVLLVEDDDGHASLMARAWRRAGMGIELVRVRDRDEARRVLDATPVGLVLLDLHLDTSTGWPLLEEMGAESVPVFVLSTSGEPSDRLRAAALGARAYFAKPGSWRGWRETVDRIGSVWRELP